MSNNNKPLIIYHGHCTDGFTAVWAARKALGPNCETVAAHFGQPEPPDVTDREVYIVDYSYPRAVLEDMHDKADSLLVLDHHKTAEADLAGLPYCQFDMNRSGAGMAWDHFHPGQPRPWLVDYVEDRDIWRKSLPDTDEVTAFIRSWQASFDRWDTISAMSLEDAISHGKAVWSFMSLSVKFACKRARVVSVLGHDNVLEVNSSVLQSEIGNALMEGEGPKGNVPDFAAVWYVGVDGKRKYSLRSDDKHTDVSAIAQQLGGGGHRNAAGCLRDGSLPTDG